MNMNSGNYSLRFKGVEKSYVDTLRDAHSGERTELLARSRRLSADTSKRRKALALRRKSQANQEEKRRQVILQKRREHIRAATEKYQRGNRNYSPEDYATESPSYSHAPTLEEALSAVRGGTSGRVRSPAPYRTYSATSATGGVARIGSASSVRSVSSTSSLNGNGQHRVQAAPQTRYNYTVSKAARQPQPSQLQDHSLRNTNSSRSLFEQQLEQHQQLLVEQQQQSLNRFNAAIQHEIEADPKLQGVEQQHDDVPMRTDSPDSLDSLEVNHSDNQRQTGVVTTREMLSSVEAESRGAIINGNHGGQNSYHHHDYSTHNGQRVTSGSSGFMLHTNRSSQSPVAVVQPQVQQERFDPNGGHVSAVKPTQHTEKNVVHDNQKIHRDQQGAVNVINTKSNGRTNGQYYQDSVVGFVSGAQQENSSALRENNLFYDKPVQEYVTTTTTKAWATPSPAIDDEVNGRDGKTPSHVTTQAATQRQLAPNATTVTFPSKNSVTAQQTMPVPHNPTSVGQQTVVTQNGSGPRPLPVAYSVNSTVTPTSTVSSAAVVTAKPPIIGSTATTNVTNQLAANIGMLNQPAPTPGMTTQPAPTTNAMSTQAMEMLKHYSQYPMYRVAEPVDTEDKNSLLSESSTLVSGSDVADESQPEPEVRSILKRFSSYGPPLKPAKGAAVSGISVGGTRVLTRSMSAHAGLRDSVEIARNKHEHRPKRAKSVRFADMDYSDESDFDIQPQINNKGGSRGLAQKPPRPGERNIQGGKTPSKIPRVSSAGTERRGPFLRPHPPTHPPPSRNAHPRTNQKAESNPVVEESSRQPVASQNVQMNDNHSNSTHQQGSHSANNHIVIPSDATPTVSKTQAVYDANGIRLDRTPTDEEINFLWDKVRTCLSRQSNSSIADSLQARNNSTPAQSPIVSQKYIDGNSLAPQFRVATRLNNTYANNYMGTTAIANTQAKKKISMDTLNSFTRRQNLLNQRNKPIPPKGISGSTQPPMSASTLVVNGVSEAQPIQSMTGPVVVAPHSNNNKQVSESMAAFLAAETLAEHSVSESQIEAAMDHASMQQHAINTSSPRQTVPTALSVEEQRLIKSLERLNERLRLTESNMYPTTALAPNPPSHHVGFKGRQPITSAPTTRRQVNSNGLVPRHHYRGGSAPVQHTSHYGGQYRYR